MEESKWTCIEYVNIKFKGQEILMIQIKNTSQHMVQHMIKSKGGNSVG